MKCYKYFYESASEIKGKDIINCRVLALSSQIKETFCQHMD